MICICTQCGAPININATLNTYVCEYCGASASYLDPDNLKKDSEPNAQEIIKLFQTDYNRHEKAERERLRQESIYTTLFGQMRGGRDEDVDDVELAYCMSDFIMAYPLPENKNAFLKFYIYANSCANKGDWDSDLFDTDEILIKAWNSKIAEIENTIDILYSQDPDIKKIPPSPKKKSRFRFKK